VTNWDSDIDAIAVFGSTARRQIDHLSDRDILFVSDKPAALRRAASRLETSGWSCINYSWSRLRKAAAWNSLFMQHLKQEAIILKDHEDILSSVLSRFSAKGSYKVEAEEAKHLLSILERIPNSIQGRYWALDVLMVGLRSLTIATLADEGIYSFSFKEMLTKLQRIGILSHENVIDLYALRRFKSKYRKRAWSPDLDWARVFHLIEIVDKRFSIGLNPVRAKPWQVLTAAVESDDNTNNWYLNSRKLEAALWCMPTHSAYADEGNATRERLFRLVRSPSEYGWVLSSEWGLLKEDLVSLTSLSQMD